MCTTLLGGPIDPERTGTLLPLPPSPTAEEKTGSSGVASLD